MKNYLVTIVILLVCLPALGQEITRAEYFWNKDPGVGKGIDIPLTPGAQIETDLTISSEDLTPGVHFLYVRTMTEAGVWGLYLKMPVYVLKPVKTYSIAGAEYFWDADPGAGNGTPVSMEETDELDLSVLASTDDLEPGMHFFYLRLKNDQNEWSPYLKRTVFVMEAASEPGSLTAYRYSFNEPPGEAAPPETEIEPGASFETEISLNPGDLPEGTHLVYFQVKDDNERWSPAVSAEFTIAACEYDAPNALSQVTPVRINENLSVDLNLALGGLSTGPLTFEVLGEPDKGDFSFDQGQVSYTALPGTLGADSIYYKVCNSCDVCDSAWWYLNIANEPPVISPAEFQTSKDKALTIPLTDLISDLNENLDPASFAIVQHPSGGATATVTQDFNLEISYRESDFSGEEQWIVEVCDLDGACAQQTFLITVEGDLRLRVFNAVSPNGDGKNDYLHIENIGQFPENQFTLVNRWGDKVFEITDYNNNDRRFEGSGNVNGSATLSSGSYFYELYIPSSGQKLAGYLYLKY